MDTFLRFTEPIITFSVVCFPITTALMMFSLKRLGYDPVGSSVKSKLSIDIDMRFFSKLRKGYKEVRGNQIIPFLNVVSFYIGLFGVVVLPIIAAVYEIW